MQIYKLTDSERSAIEALNARRLNVLMIVCDYGPEIGCGLVHDDLNKTCYADYRALLGETLDSERIAEWSEDTLA